LPLLRPPAKSRHGFSKFWTCVSKIGNGTLAERPPGWQRPFEELFRRIVSMDSPLSTDSVVVASPEQVSCPLGEESVILNMTNSVYYGVNPVGSSIWKLLQQKRTVAELRDAVMEEYEVGSAQCERDLLDLLEKMRSEGLVRVVEPVAG
jgi:hypothetical protein